MLSKNFKVRISNETSVFLYLMWQKSIRDWTGEHAMYKFLCAVFLQLKMCFCMKLLVGLLWINRGFNNQCSWCHERCWWVMPPGFPENFHFQSSSNVLFGSIGGIVKIDYKRSPNRSFLTYLTCWIKYMQLHLEMFIMFITCFEVLSFG